MSFTRLLTLIIYSATSALGNYHFGYLGFQPQLSPLSPNPVYSSGVDGNLGFNGFSYFKDFGGAKSGVTFFNGPGSQYNFDDGLPGAAPATQVKDSEIRSVANADVSSAIAPIVPVDSKDFAVTPAAPEKKGDTIAASMEIKDFKDPAVVAAPIGGAGYEAPYPIFRFGGSASYYPDQATPFSGFSGYSGYEQPDNFRPQYEPYQYFGSYQSANSPLYPWFDADYNYNPAFPFAYQPPASTASVQSNSIAVKSTDSIIPKIDKRFRGESPTTSTTEKVVTTIADSTTSEISSTTPESPTTSTTEKVVTTIADSTTSEISSSTPESTETTTTTVADDSAAVP